MGNYQRKYIRFQSEDFKISVPFDTKNINKYLLEHINNLNPGTKYILDEEGADWVRFIDINDPQNTITFTKIS